MKLKIEMIQSSNAFVRFIISYYNIMHLCHRSNNNTPWSNILFPELPISVTATVHQSLCKTTYKGRRSTFESRYSKYKENISNCRKLRVNPIARFVKIGKQGYINPPSTFFPPSSIFWRCQMITLQKAYIYLRSRSNPCIYGICTS